MKKIIFLVLFGCLLFIPVEGNIEVYNSSIDLNKTGYWEGADLQSPNSWWDCSNNNHTSTSCMLYNTPADPEYGFGCISSTETHGGSMLVINLSDHMVTGEWSESTVENAIIWGWGTNEVGSFGDTNISYDLVYCDDAVSDNPPEVTYRDYNNSVNVDLSSCYAFERFDTGALASGRRSNLSTITEIITNETNDDGIFTLIYNTTAQHGGPGCGSALDFPYYTSLELDINYTIGLNINFSESTNVTLSWIDGGEYFQDVTTITIPSSNITDGIVTIDFNQGTQRAQFTDNGSAVYLYYTIITPDLDVKVKVKSDGAETEGILVEALKFNNDTGNWEVVGSGYTDVIGETYCLLDDAEDYQFRVSGEDYITETHSRYVPDSLTDALVLTIDDIASAVTGRNAWSSCGYEVDDFRNCTIYGYSMLPGTLNITIYENATKRSGQGYGNRITLTNAGGSEQEYPINVSFYRNGLLIKFFQITSSGEAVTTRDYQVIFPVELITASRTNRIVFFLVAAFMGLLISGMVGSRFKGMGAYALIGWFVLIAIGTGLLEYWAMMAPGVIYIVLKEVSSRFKVNRM